MMYYGLVLKMRTKKGGQMEDIRMNIESIRVNMGLTRPEMAERMEVNIDRYNRLATGESKMLAVELIKLHQVSGVPYDNIVVLA